MTHSVIFPARRVAWLSIAGLGMFLVCCNNLIGMAWPTEVMLCLVWGLMVYVLAVRILMRRRTHDDGEILSMLFNDAPASDAMASDVSR